MLKITNLSDYNLENSKNIIIVPETFSHNYERFLCQKYSNKISKSTEVLTFSRISDRIFAEIGGFANNYINDSGRILAMYNAINSVFPSLKVYNSNKIEIITKLLQAIDEFKMYKISENDLLSSLDDLDGVLKLKIQDLFYIYSAYNKITEVEIQDPRKELDFLCENFHKSTIYDEFNVYFDKFDGFTRQQYDLIAEFLKKNINVTITLDIENETDKLYDLSSTARETMEYLQRMCEIYSFNVKKEFFNKDKRKFDEIAQNIFEIDKILIENSDISMHISTTVQNECLHTAGKIIEIISKNKDIRFRDILVTARNFEQYDQQLRVAFERFNIPLYVAKKDNIMKKTPIRVLISALNIILNKYKSEYVIDFLKSPILNLGDENIYKFEDYILRWDIKYITKSLVFTANPSYKLQKVDENEQKTLDFYNEYKNKQLNEVFNLENSLKKSKTGEDYVSAMYEFCQNIRLDMKINVYETEKLEIKQQYEQLWDIIVDSFDQFYEISGNQEMMLEEFVKLYKMLLESYEISEIPSSLDNVSCGDFERIVGEKCKILFILGADSDNLPAKIKENPILSDNERDILENLEIEMAPYGNDLVIREFELVSRVLSLPEDMLFISYSEVSDSKNTPSSVFKRIVEIVDEIHVSTDLTEQYNFMYKSTKTALEQLAINKENEKISQIDENILKIARKDVIDKELVERIYSKRISPTALDVYLGCRFRYFMQYGLKVKPRQTIEFNQLHNGNFIHYILENILQKDEYETINTNNAVALLIEKYTNEIFSENFLNNPKFEYLYENLKENTHKIVLNIIDEIRDSEFKPYEYELEINENSKVKPLQIGDFSVVGKVDRVDVYKSGEKTFLRIIDYKSGVKKLDLSQFYHGINMQMLIYLLAIEQSESYIPSVTSSGVLYIPTKMPKISKTIPLSEEEKEVEVNKNRERSGLLIKDVQILEKMEKNTPFIYLPVKLNKDNSISKTTTSVADAEQFEGLKGLVLDKLNEATESLKSGKNAPNPYIYDEKSSCTYCDFSSCCGFSVNYESQKHLKKFKNDEFWSEIEERGAKK